MTARAYYNENDTYNAQWLRNLIAAGHIAPGEVDDRSITDVRYDDLRGFTQCHFFAGIGIWSDALRRAGWPDDRRVWTGSCPCQPFSSAGARRGHEDERHLWPAWYGLICEQGSVPIFGEQVAGGDGEAWLDHVATDLEELAYSVGAVSTPACGFGAPHERQRNYFVAHPQRGPTERHRPELGGEAGGMPRGAQQRERIRHDPRDGLAAGELADAERDRREARPGSAREPARAEPEEHGHAERRRGSSGMVDAPGPGLEGSAEPGTAGPGQKRAALERAGAPRLLAHTDGSGQPGQRWHREGRASQPGATRAMADVEHDGGRADQPRRGAEERAADGIPGPVNGYWANADWVRCRPEPRAQAGRWRPIEPGTFPLAYGTPGRMGRLRAYGNAICAPQAEEFIRAYMSVIE